MLNLHMAFDSRVSVWARSVGLALWLCSTSLTAAIRVAIAPLSFTGAAAEGIPMKKVLIALVATLVAVSVSGCVGVGKGKAPPPIVTKG